MPKRVVVTGGSGRVGRYVLAELATDMSVVNADIAAATAGPHGQPPAKVEFVQTDVMDLDAVRCVLEGADAVVHLAAIDYDWKASPEDYIRVNTLGTWNVLQAAQEAGTPRVVLCSSISICGLSEMREDWVPTALPVTEEHENRPVQAYSISKLLMEDMGLAVSRSGAGVSVVNIRPMAVVLRETLDEFLEFIDAENRRWLFYYIEASDLARAFRAAVEAEGISCESFFISADDTCRSERTLDWYGRIIDEPPADTDEQRYQADPRASIFSNAKAERLLGWRPRVRFDELRAEMAEKRSAQ